MLRQGNCVKRITDVAAQQLEAKSGESFLIRSIYVAPETDNTFLVLKVDRKTVGVYRIYGKSGNHLAPIRLGFTPKHLMEFLTSKGVNCTIPIGEGQSFSLSAVGPSPVVVIVYDTYDAGDITPVMPNGTDSKEYMFMQYMDTSATIDAAETVELDVSLSPAEFPDFPCGRSVPANIDIEILGLVGSPSGTGDTTANYIGTSYIKMVKERETLFDEDRNGIPFFYAPNETTSSYSSAFTLIAPCVEVRPFTESVSLEHDAPLGDPLIFDPSLKFAAGEELLIYLSILKVGSASFGDKVDIAAIMNVKSL